MTRAWWPTGSRFASCSALATWLPSVAQAAAEHHAAGPPRLNLWAWEPHAPPIAWFLFDFAVFVGGLAYLSARPLAAAFAQRHDSIQKAISQAATAHARAISEQHMRRERLARIESEVQALQRTSRLEGERERDQIIEEAQAHAARLHADSVAQADQELRRAQIRLRAAALKMVLANASQRLRLELSDVDRASLIDASVARIAAASPGHVALRRPGRAGA